MELLIILQAEAIDGIEAKIKSLKTDKYAHTGLMGNMALGWKNMKKLTPKKAKETVKNDWKKHPEYDENEY